MIFYSEALLDEIDKIMFSYLGKNASISSGEIKWKLQYFMRSGIQRLIDDSNANRDYDGVKQAKCRTYKNTALGNYITIYLRSFWVGKMSQIWRVFNLAWTNDCVIHLKRKCIGQCLLSVYNPLL